MLVSTAIVAHSTRKAQAFDLAITLDASIAYDLGDHGPGANHRRAWQLANTPAADWILIIEDDAIPCPNFHTRLAEALTTAPTPIVSLYLGTGYPLHLVDQAAEAMSHAQAQHKPWLTLPTMNHAVAICIRQPLVADMLHHTDPDQPIDEAIGAWAQSHSVPISYSVPSLVDHRDQPPITAHPDGLGRTRPRRAIAFDCS
jgi:hypothetical protein